MQTFGISYKENLCLWIPWANPDPKMTIPMPPYSPKCLEIHLQSQLDAQHKESFHVSDH